MSSHNSLRMDAACSEPTTSVVSTSSVPQKTSSDKAINENKVDSPKRTPKKSKKKQRSEVTVPTMVFNNSSINDVSNKCQNLQIESDSDNGETEQVTPTTPSKGKNAKKKERLKKLEIPTVPVNNFNNTNRVQNSQYLFNYFGSPRNSTFSVHEYFTQQITPLYASTSSRYLENLCHHPQYQYMQNIQHMRDILQSPEHVASVPITPLILSGQRSEPVCIPNSTFIHSEPSTPRFIENALQHPLLNPSFSRQTGTIQIGQLRLRHNSENNCLTKTLVNGDKKFDAYLSGEDVEKGLKNNMLIEGVLRINPKQYQHSYVSSQDRSQQDILIDGIKNRNRAMEGDVVIVQLVENEPEENVTNPEQKRGKVVFIKEKVHTRTCIGSLKLMHDKNRQKAMFVPRDHRVPRINIPFTSWPDNFYEDAKKYENTLFVAKIIDWSDTRFAVGKIMGNIGKSGDMVTETKAILAENDLDVTAFGSEYKDLYPQLDFTIPDEEIAKREDCRMLCIFSIDPFNCRDIDDAVSCKELENGNYEIGVHISDVTYFLNENTPLDVKVAEKATTIYLVETAYHMLPDDLCMLCSLFPGVDKLAFSVFWEMTKDAKVISYRFARTVINSCCQLAYEHAQDVLDDKEDAQIKFPEMYNGFDYKDVHKSIKILGKLSNILRANRFENGALRIDQPKASFRLNPTSGLPESYCIYESKESHQLIEEFMLLANMSVATRIYSDHPKLAFLRSHPPPSKYMLMQLEKSLKPMGIKLDIESAGHLHRSLLPYVGPDNTDKGRAMVLNLLCAKPMTRAKYFCAAACDDDEFQHYALNVPLYTHFTSPIRRYADIMVHRLLAASLNYRETPAWQEDDVRMIAAQCNKQKYNAKKAGEMSTELYTLKYIELNSPIVTEGAVVDIREKYIDVIIVSMGLNRRIFFNNDFPGEYKCIRHEELAKLARMELKWKPVNELPETKQVIGVFSIVQVEMHKGDDMVKIETKLVRPQ
ncbi:DIS3-like exonuclease 2 [Bombyx mori]|uniref:RNB domain-containing protein n=1 Tax=Bombyx mori TaxID=7091 RepID=A0A8R2DMQ5_BOMMO|nr:DIS3-like exonuclease 2 [Bombyx mori]